MLGAHCESGRSWRQDGNGGGVFASRESETSRVWPVGPMACNSRHCCYCCSSLFAGGGGGTMSG